MQILRIFVSFFLFCFLLLPIHVNSAQPSKTPVTVKFGTIPVLQSLSVFVAQEKGFFKEQGINVEVILFNSAMEKDVALTSGQIAGYFGDLMTPMVLQGNKAGVKMVATNFNTTSEQRMFAILAAPKNADKELPEIAKAGIGTGSNTISDYLIIRLLQPKKIDANTINLIDVKGIPIRLQMLLSSQIPAALMPEPMATLAESKGAKALIDDKGRGLSATVFAFNEKFLKQYPQAVKAFNKAVNKAADYINKNPDEVRTIMNRECKVPEPLQTSFPIPKFPKLVIPDPAQVLDVYKWLRQKQIITRDMTYKDVVADGYLP
ncbi:MAG TPA: ABC transporter substrate-binding protein [Syntrophorhabdaceae bacterium]|nr:ABC transporter substrate-binding protein [Syntrophorhabdaceae bacterium]